MRVYESIPLHLSLMLKELCVPQQLRLNQYDHESSRQPNHYGLKQEYQDRFKSCH